jgi:putative DNA primase/helicase
MSLSNLIELRQEITPEPVPLIRKSRMVGDQLVEGSPYGYLENVLRVLRQDSRIRGQIKLNGFENRIQIKLPMMDKAEILRDEFETMLNDWLSRVYELRIQPKMLHEAVVLIAYENQFHPIRELIDEAPWDGVHRVDEMLIKYFGIEDTPLHRAYSRRWCIGVMKRIFDATIDRPIFVKSILVFTGRQSVGKSTALKALSLRPAWFGDTSLDMTSEKAIYKIQGKMIYELAEWSKRSKDAEQEKAFISTAMDRVRVPYARNAVDFPRQGIMAVTSNRMDLLNDSTGSTRFWVVKVGETKEDPTWRIDYESLADNALQIWREAKTLKDEQHWLTDEEEALRIDASERFAAIDPWGEQLADNLTLISSSVNDVICIDPSKCFEVLDIPMAKRTSGTRARIEFCLRSMGYTEYRPRIKGKRPRLYRKL